MKNPFDKYAAKLPPGGWVMCEIEGHIVFTSPEHRTRVVIGDELVEVDLPIYRDGK